MTYELIHLQAATFDAERQAFYDNEQHLKSRIQSLASRKRLAPQASSQSLKSIQQPRKSLVSEPSTQTLAEEPEIVDEVEDIEEAEEEDPTAPDAADEAEPAEMTALKLELSTLSTSYTSLQTTLNMLQTQLADLQRVHQELQEENESYMILLHEKTLSGNYDLVRQVGGGAADSVDEDESDGDSVQRDVDLGSIRSSERGTPLELISEEPGEDAFDQDLEQTLHAQDNRSPTSAHGRNSSRRRGGSSPPRIKGETLADLPVAGPGLDLAAELGRAENKDILEGNAIDDKERSPGKNKRGKKHSTEPSKISEGEVDALRNEVKSLKDANKALSLYASKILDRIISQEGFEHVLAVDFEKSAPPPTPKSPLGGDPQTARPLTRPQSSLLPPVTPTTKKERRSTIMSPPQPPPTSSTSSASSPPPASTATKSSRRSMSFDWKSFSLFGGNNSNAEKKTETPNLRSLTLKPGNPTITGARKVETQEDEDDRRERERLSATMKLMGIEPALSPPVTATVPTVPPSPAVPPSASNPTSPATSSSRWPFFRRGTSGSEQGSNGSTPSLVGSRVGLGLNGEDAAGVGSLTQEALEQAEAENTLAALDAHERELSAEMAKGGSGGFTDIVPRRSIGQRRHMSSGRSRTSGGRSSGSTVWSAGMSVEGAED
jgi:hypothetical protein